ncbi:O-antigen ligase family protein [Oceanobacillus profundus]|uniref:O-antigen ligase family protein n=1 Tax=Oceanobacillus profundus TaxID=372463 RepID=UPI0020417F3B|nr:O-antigen ligase family protein [Oceanobacillus profundus]MCM3399456.1 O-antigen ligase family protein [Oceanobacillus profundus]
MDRIYDSSKEENYLVQNKLTSYNVNFAKIGIAFFTICFSTINTMLSSENVKLMLLFFVVIFLISHYFFGKKGVILTNFDIIWLFFLFSLYLNIILKYNISHSALVDLIVYTSCVVFILLAKMHISQYEISFKLIKLFAVIYALSAIFQYLFTDIYLRLILPLFPTWAQSNILNLLYNNTYTGITNQTAYLAGFIVTGIGIIIFSFNSKSKFAKVISVITILLLLFALILAAKRAHTIFMVISLVSVYLVSVRKKEVIIQIIKFTLISLLVTLFIIFVLNFYKEDIDTPLGSFSNEIINTVEGISSGEDITTGRSILYSYSWELFKENPIIGIGWGEFINNSKGLINSDRGSHPHNIYLQLLTELGLVGFTLFLLPLTYVYYKTVRVLRLVVNNKEYLKDDRQWKTGLQFSLYSQTFFILYGMSGNLLTDHNFLIMYFLASSISISAIVKINKAK